MDNIKNITCEDFDDQVEYIFAYFEKEDDISVICDRDIAREISDLYDEEDFKNYYSIEMSTEDDIYIIGKIKDEIFSIEPAYHHGTLLGFEGDLVIVQKELFVNDIKEYVEDFDNVIVVGLEEDEEELEETECNCAECNDFECEHNCNSDNDEDMEEAEEYVLEKIKQYRNDDIDTIEELCFQIYETAYNDGFDSALLSMKNSIDEALED